MKKRTLIKLLIAVALCLAAALFLYTGELPEYDETQNVSFVVEPLPAESGTQSTKTDALPTEPSTQEDKEPSDDKTAIDDGFDLADELLPTAFYLEEVKDFQTDVERAAAKEQETPTVQDQMPVPN